MPSRIARSHVKIEFGHSHVSTTKLFGAMYTWLHLQMTNVAILEWLANFFTPLLSLEISWRAYYQKEIHWKLSHQVNERALSYQEPKRAVRQILQAWLPLASAILDMAWDQLPSPMAAAKSRQKRLFPSLLDETNAKADLLQASILSSCPESFISCAAQLQ